MSPDGRWIAYVVSSLNADGSEYQTDVWMVPASGGDARQITNSNVADEFPRWSADGKTLGFLSDRPRPGAPPADPKVPDEGKRQLWLIHPDGGEAWQLTDAKGGVSSFEWSHDGKSVAYLSREPKTEEREERREGQERRVDAVDDVPLGSAVGDRCREQEGDTAHERRLPRQRLLVLARRQAARDRGAAGRRSSPTASIQTSSSSRPRAESRRRSSSSPEATAIRRGRPTASGSRSRRSSARARRGTRTTRCASSRRAADR